MTRKKWLTLEELLEAPVPVSLINEPIDHEVELAVKETATEHAIRIWRMEQPTQ